MEKLWKCLRLTFFASLIAVGQAEDQAATAGPYDVGRFEDTGQFWGSQPTAGNDGDIFSGGR